MEESEIFAGHGLDGNVSALPGTEQVGSTLWVGHQLR